MVGVDEGRVMLEDGVDAFRAWRARVLADEEEGRVISTVAVCAAGGIPLGLAVPARFSPLAAANLFVNDEIAQPAQPALAAAETSGCGVPMRGVLLLEVTVFVGGRMVSGIVAACLRIRAK